jgi:hypothetical protein
MPSSYFWLRTSENAQEAKFAEFLFHALRSRTPVKSALEELEDGLVDRAVPFDS